MDQNKKITSQDSLKNCEIRRIMDPSIKAKQSTMSIRAIAPHGRG